MTLFVNFEKRIANARVPMRMSNGAAGYDLTAVTGTILETGLVEYDTGIAVAIPEGYVGLLAPRSSISNQPGWRLANSVGIIDSDYRGSIRVRFRADRAMPGLPYKVGDRIAQLVLIPCPTVVYNEVENLSETERDVGGFGSTDT